LVEVGVADAAEEDVDEHIAWPRVASLERPRCQWVGGGWDGVGGGRNTHSDILRSRVGNHPRIPSKIIGHAS
jgi:hypothetical protein